MKSIELYRKLVQKLDAHQQKLVSEYGEYIRCGEGCSSCCILQSVFPVEAYMIYRSFINDETGRRSLSFKETPDRCVFLSGGSCAIYSSRPVICRTHGYPVFADGRTDFCPENFTGLDTIGSEFILDLDNLNRALVSINIIFQREIDIEFFSAERIAMKELKEFILK